MQEVVRAREVLPWVHVWSVSRVFAFKKRALAEKSVTMLRERNQVL